MKYLLSFWLFAYVFVCSLSAVASPLPVAEGEADHRYRDSLRRHIFDTGTAEFDCYLSYPIGESAIYPDMGNNGRELAVLRRFLSHALEDTLVCVQQITITGYCSIDGTDRVNDVLSQRRAERFFRYLDAGYQIEAKYPVEVKSKGADWVKFRKLVEASSYVWKRDALLIIDGTSNREWKKMQLSQLSGGRAHEQLYELYPLLRRVEVRINYDVQCMKNKIERAGIPKRAIPRVQVLRLKAMNIVPTPPSRPRFALKTNLLFDAALMPNVEVEVPLGKRWSVQGEWMFPWWLFKGDKYCLQVLSGSVEGRYWLGNRYWHKPLLGHFVGFYAGGGMYDLQWQKNGYQGEFYVASGVSYGYTLALGRRLNLEFCIGVGLLKTGYEHYHALEDYQLMIWQNDGNYTWLGPTKAKISLVWLLGKRKGGAK